MTALRKPIDWRQCEYLSLTNAGRVAGKSAAWARGAVCTGELEAVRLPNGGAEVIRVQSLLDFLKRSRPISAADLANARPPTMAVQ